MAMSKAEKRNTAKKIAESKSQARKSMRDSNPKNLLGDKVVKGKKSLGAGKKK